MQKDDFSFYKKFLYDKSGLAITEDKIYLLQSRLTPLAKKWKLDTLENLTKALRSSSDPKLVAEVVDAMTTNETLFFRDDRPFKQFRTFVLPELMKTRSARKSLRIWSAASSTGQEPYSIAMTLLDVLPPSENWKIEIYATDISETALAQAKKGEYNQFEIQRGLPIQMVMKYFKQDGQTWSLNDKIKSMVKFEPFNLLQPMERLGTFDIIFCRNVLIYFDEETKKKVLQNMMKRLPTDGFLFLGGSETVLGLCPELKMNPGSPGLYTLTSPVAPAKAAAAGI